MKKNFIKSEYGLSRGFTLVEVIVSLGLFLIVITISMGALLNIVDADRKAQSIKSAMDNLNSALESMTRNVRMGDNYNCTGSPTSGGDDCLTNGSDAFYFVPSKTTVFQGASYVKYYLDSGKIKRTVVGGSSAGDAEMTGSDITITNLKFYVYGASALGAQPRVLMVVQGEAGSKDKLKTYFSLQTVMTQRNPDN